MQVLRNAGGGGVSDFLEKSIMKVYGSMLLALRGGGWGSNFQKKVLRNTWMAPNVIIIHNLWLTETAQDWLPQR